MPLFYILIGQQESNAIRISKQHYKIFNVLIAPQSLFTYLCAPKLKQYTMKNLTLPILTAGLLLSLSAFSAPAKKIPTTIKQPNGKTITVIKQGDEFHSFYVTEDGIALKLCSDGFLRYYNNDGVTVSKITASDPEERTQEELAFLSTSNKDIVKKSFTKIYSENKSRRAPKRTNIYKNVKEGEKVNGLVIMVEFNDKKFTHSKEDINNLLNQEHYSENGSIGSARDYFLDQSNNQFDITFDVVGPIKTDKGYAYYGGNGSYPDVNIFEFVEEVCNKAGNTGIDLSKYDQNNDNEVDLVFFLYAGNGENSSNDSNTIWPHAASLKDNGINMQVGDFTINNYACTAELNEGGSDKICGIGTFCHEFSHTLGLPDLYDVTYLIPYTTGTWSLMDEGCYNADSYVPVGYSAYEKNSVGWLDPVVLDKTPQTITIGKTIETNEAYKMVSDEKENEFYFIENRVQEGWDTYIKCEGLMITSVSYDETSWKNNNVNSFEPLGCYFIAADNVRTKDTESGDLYPNGNNNSFTDSTSPASVTNSKNRLGQPITEITKNSDKTVTFKYMGGEGYTLPTPVAKEATNIRDNQFVANWEVTEGASEYYLYINKMDGNDIVSTQKYNYTGENTNKALIKNLSTDTKYTYYVIAYVDNMKTVPSNSIEVILGTVGIEDSQSDNISIQVQDKNIIIDSNKKQNIRIYNIEGCLIKDTNIEEGTSVFNLNSNGVYIIKCGNKTEKVCI